MAGLGQWLGAGEHQLEGAQGDGFLQGLLLSEITAPGFVTATERRVVLLDGVSVPGRATPAGRPEPSLCFEASWSAVRGYWTGVVPFPPEWWRFGPEGRVILLSVDPDVGGGRDLVVHAGLAAWLAACRSMGVRPVRD